MVDLTKEDIELMKKSNVLFLDDEEELKKGLLVAIKIRSAIKASREIKETLLRLNLKYKNNLVLLKNTKENLGMLKKAKDYISYGIIDNDTLKELLNKRSREYHQRLFDSNKKYAYNKYYIFNNKPIHKVFKLAPPKKGFRKGAKLSYSQGGVLGFNKEINDLIKRML